MTLASPTPTQLDSGAQVTATLDGSAISASTPAAVLGAASIDPTLLASTSDANTSDPYIAEKAAELDYDPDQIFAFVRDDIGNNVYLGALLGARGTLWNGAGNSLDKASLLVGLLRASGVPAEYQQGTLSPTRRRI